MTGGFLRLGGRLTGGFFGSFGGGLRGSSRLLAICNSARRCHACGLNLSRVIDSVIMDYF